MIRCLMVVLMSVCLLGCAHSYSTDDYRQVLQEQFPKSKIMAVSDNVFLVVVGSDMSCVFSFQESGATKAECFVSKK
jgi:hypothetical protein